MARCGGRDAVSLSDLNAGGFLTFESKHLETVKEVQEQPLDTFEQFNRQQLAHGKQEMVFASEFAGKITSARSVSRLERSHPSSSLRRTTARKDRNR
jgi:hypothetical protein